MTDYTVMVGGWDAGDPANKNIGYVEDLTAKQLASLTDEQKIKLGIDICYCDGGGSIIHVAGPKCTSGPYWDKQDAKA